MYLGLLYSRQPVQVAAEMPSAPRRPPLSEADHENARRDHTLSPKSVQGNSPHGGHPPVPTYLARARGCWAPRDVRRQRAVLLEEPLPASRSQ